MIVTLTGNIATDVKSQYMMKDGQYMMDTRSGKPLMVTEFKMAVSRGPGKTKTGHDGKTYDSDLYRVKAIGQKAEFLAQYASKGRGVCVQGNLLQDEWLAQNQTVQIDRNNPMYGVLAQYVGQPNSPIVADGAGNLYMVGTTHVQGVTVEVVQIDFTGANPNGQQFDQTSFQPTMAMPGMLPTQPQVGAPLTMPTAVPSQGGYAPVQQPAPTYPTMPQQNAPNTMLQMNGMTVPFGNNAQPSVMPVMPQQQATQPAMQQQAQPTMPVNPAMQQSIAPNMGGVVMQQPQANPVGNVGMYPGFNGPSDVPAEFTNIQMPQSVAPVTQPATPVAQGTETQTQPQSPVTNAPTESKEKDTTNFTPEPQGGVNQGF